MSTFKKFSGIIFCVALLGAFFAHAGDTHAATLYLAPASGSYAVGESFSVSVYVGSSDQSMNAVSGTVSFATSLLRVTAIGKDTSIISSWSPGQPSFSNTTGQVSFEGIDPNPGYAGAKGRILTISFKALAPGTATLAIANGSVLANDGLGTEIITGTSKASFSLKPAPAPTTPTPTPEPPPVIVESPIPPTEQAVTDKPTIDSYPRHLSDNDFMIVSGHAAPNATVNVFIQQADNDNVVGSIFQTSKSMLTHASVLADKNGVFTFAYSSRVHRGFYTLYATAQVDGSAESQPSDVVTITVDPTLWQKIVKFAFSMLIVAVPIIGAALLLVWIFFFIRRRRRAFRVRIRDEIKKTQSTLGQNMDGLGNEVRNEIAFLQKLHNGEPLFTQEQEFLTRLEHEIAMAKSSMEQKVNGIDAELGK